MDDDTIILTDYAQRKIRLTSERQTHILQHPEMVKQLARIQETVESPESVVVTTKDDSVHVYQRYYELTPVTSKFLLVPVKFLEEDAFVLTAFFSRREKKGTIIWTA